MSQRSKEFINEALLDAMDRQGFNASSLARECRLSRPTLWRTLRGIGKPTLASRFKIARALNCTPADLFPEAINV